MPELPEVETVRRGLQPVLEGRRIVTLEQRRPNLRIPFPIGFAGFVEGRRVTALRRRAKYLLIDLEDDQVLICHLGMSGRMVVLPAGSNQPPDKHDHVVFTTETGDRVVYNDHRRFGLMTLTTARDEATHPLLASIALDPLQPGFDADHLSARLAGKKTPIKAALLDQRVVGGVGNIYASEALHRAGISPRRQAASVAGKRAQRLVPAMVDVLNEAIAAGGSSLRDHRQASGELGYFQHSFRVYDRTGEPCPTRGCQGVIDRIVQANRSTFFCGACQR